MPADDHGQALNLLGVRPGRVVALRDVPRGNANWLVETAGGERCVLRRYHPETTRADLAYEHAVLGYLAGVGGESSISGSPTRTAALTSWRSRAPTGRRRWPMPTTTWP